MHELGIVKHVIQTLEQVAQAHQLTTISSVTLEIGEVSGVLGDYLTDCWKWAVSKTDLLQGAALRIEALPAVTLCRACGAEYETVRYGKTCPHCGSEETHLLRGTELNIKEIEVPE